MYDLLCFLCLTQEILFYAKVKDSCLDFLRIAFVFHTELFNPSFVVKFTSFSVAFPLRGYFESSPSSKATSAVSPPSPCAPPALGTLRVRQGDFSVSGALFMFVTLEVLVSCCGPWLQRLDSTSVSNSFSFGNSLGACQVCFVPGMGNGL